jgi:hypothetical protein
VTIPLCEDADVLSWLMHSDDDINSKAVKHLRSMIWRCGCKITKSCSQVVEDVGFISTGSNENSNSAVFLASSSQDSWRGRSQEHCQ